MHTYSILARFGWMILIMPSMPLRKLYERLIDAVYESAYHILLRVFLSC